jgi:hypothetical protein
MATTIRIANQHSAIIALPRVGGGGVVLPAILLQPHSVTPVDAAAWKILKECKSVQNYLDKHLLAEVRRDDIGNVPIETSTVDTEANVPAHLSGDEEGTQAKGEVKARVTRKKAGTLKVG